jgi:hypothetical protein
MTEIDDQGGPLAPRSKAIPATKPFVALSSSTWIARVKERATRGVVLIETSERFASGFVVSSRGRRKLVVTNKHVTVGANYDSIRSDDYPRTHSVLSKSGRQMTGRLAALATNDELDLANASVSLLRLISSLEKQLGVLSKMYRS